MLIKYLLVILFLLVLVAIWYDPVNVDVLNELSVDRKASKARVVSNARAIQRKEMPSIEEYVPTGRQRPEMLPEVYVPGSVRDEIVMDFK